MNRYICIHGHFYQPPRENPWLEAIEFQDSAYPYNDWNARITAECYLPNTASRILDERGNILDIVNNYSKMSFNFGPTVLSWLEKNSPRTYKMILEADKEGQKNYSGHGCALAQVYNHIIMPLANEQDKQTQVIWGIKDFESRFNRKPEGMWLAETAVDTKTLETLVKFDIKFTILSPYQAKRIRKINSNEWFNMEGGNIDPKMPYICKLPSGKTIVLFFYDGPIAQDVAFGPLLKSGVDFANRLLATFSQSNNQQLAHIATDGETYGHHHKFGNMALAYLFNHIEKNNLSKLTIYAEFLEKFPPTYEVQIFENSSWSCSHGIERWRSNCSCRVGFNPGWDQKWRIGLRKAMDWLRDKLMDLYEKEMYKYVKDPWEMRDNYINVILDRSSENTERFFSMHLKDQVSYEDKTKILELLEMQRNAMYMYTSCGWFFDDISGIESIQVIQYAAMAIQLANKTLNIDLEEEYLKILDTIKSNKPQCGTGRDIYNSFVKPSKIDLLNVGAHYAISSLFEDYPEQAKIYCYQVDNEVYDKEVIDRHKLVIGKTTVRSLITWNSKIIEYAVLHNGSYNLTVGVREFSNENKFQNMHASIKNSFIKKDTKEVLKIINHEFKNNLYTLWDLFKNEQGKAMNNILNYTVENIVNNFREIYDEYYPLLQSKKNIRLPFPKALEMTVEFILNKDLAEKLESDQADLGGLQKIAEDIKRWSFMRDKEWLSLIATRKINKLMDKLLISPEDAIILGDIEAILRIIIDILQLEPDLWHAQNVYFAIGKELREQMMKKVKKGDKLAQFWLEHFNKLSNHFKISTN